MKKSFFLLIFVVVFQTVFASSIFQNIKEYHVPNVQNFLISECYGNQEKLGKALGCSQSTICTNLKNKALKSALVRLVEAETSILEELLNKNKKDDFFRMLDDLGIQISSLPVPSQTYRSANTSSANSSSLPAVQSLSAMTLQRTYDAINPIQKVVEKRESSLSVIPNTSVTTAKHSQYLEQKRAPLNQKNIDYLDKCSFKEDTFIVFNVGQGNCNLFVPKDDIAAVILYDCGSRGGLLTIDLNGNDVNSTEPNIDFIASYVRKSLDNRKEKKLCVVISHADSDHLNKMKELIEKIGDGIQVEFFLGGNKAAYISASASDFVTFAEDFSKQKLFFADDSKPINVGREYTSDILARLINSDPNKESIVLKILNSNSKNSVLLTGDAEDETVKSIVHNQKPCSHNITVMVAPHHGAETEGSNGLDFIKTVGAKNVVFSSSKHGPREKHPSTTVLKRYLESKSLQNTPLHVVSYQGDEVIERELGLIPLGNVEINQGSPVTFNFALTKNGVFHTRNSGHIILTLSNPIRLDFFGPSLPIFPNPLKHLTNLNLSNFNMTSDDISYLATEWLNLIYLKSLNIEKNAIDLLHSKQDLEELIKIRGNDFDIKIEPQYARPTDMQAKIEVGRIIFPVGDYERKLTNTSDSLEPLLTKNFSQQAMSVKSGHAEDVIQSSLSIFTPKLKSQNSAYRYEDKDIFDIIDVIFPIKEDFFLLSCDAEDVIQNYVRKINSVYVLPVSSTHHLQNFKDIIGLFFENKKINFSSQQTVLLPYNINNNHWVTLCLEILRTGNVSLTYIDSIHGSKVDVERLKAELVTIPSFKDREITTYYIVSQIQPDKDSCGVIVVENMDNLICGRPLIRNLNLTHEVITYLREKHKQYVPRIN